MDFEQMRVAELLRESKCVVGSLKAPAEPGVYAVFCSKIEKLGVFSVGEGGLIYVGASKDLAAREFDQHFSSEGTGISTLRRSLGAILKGQLELTAIPRSPGSVSSSYRFLADGEKRLTQWMKSNLEVSVCPIEDAVDVETELVRLLRPVLNLTKWENPQRAEIKRLRKDCADEAQRK